MALDFNDPVNMIVVGALSITVISLIVVGGWAAISSLPASDKEYAGNKTLDNIYDDAKGNDALSNAFMTSKIDISTETNSCSFLVTYKGNRDRRVDCTTGCQGGPDDPNSKFCRQYIYKGGDEGNETGILGEDMLDETYVRRRKAAQSDDEDEPPDVDPNDVAGLEAGSLEGCVARGVKQARSDTGVALSSCDDIDEDSACSGRDHFWGGWGGSCSTCYVNKAGSEKIGIQCMKNPERHSSTWGFGTWAGIFIFYAMTFGVPTALISSQDWSSLAKIPLIIMCAVVNLTVFFQTLDTDGGVIFENSVKDGESICINSVPVENCDTKG